MVFFQQITRESRDFFLLFRKKDFFNFVISVSFFLFDSAFWDCCIHTWRWGPRKTLSVRWAKQCECLHLCTYLKGEKFEMVFGHDNTFRSSPLLIFWFFFEESKTAQKKASDWIHYHAALSSEFNGHWGIRVSVIFSAPEWQECLRDGKRQQRKRAIEAEDFTLDDAHLVHLHVSMYFIIPAHPRYCWIVLALNAV